MPDTRRKVGVIGGGIAGLTAAYRLAQAGHDVTLWERGQRFGGQAATFEVNGANLEYFYHHLFQSDKEIVALANELGVGDKLMWLPSTVGYLSGGKIYPLNGAIDLLRLGSIPFIDRLRVGLTTFYLQHVRDWKRFELVTAKDWLTRAIGRRAYDRTFGAQLKAKFGRYEDQVAMVWFWGKIWLRTTSRRTPLDQEKLGYFRGSFDVIVEALVDGCRRVGVDLQLGRGPKQLRPATGETWDAFFDDQSEPERFEAIVATVPSPIFQRLAPALPGWYVKKLEGTIYESAVITILELAHPLTDVYWLNIADTDIPFTGVIEHTNFIPPSHYGGSHLVYLSRYLEPDHPYLTLPDDQLIAEYLPYLKRLNPKFEPSWIKKRWVFRARAAQPVVTLNYSAKIPEHRTPLPNLYLANTTQIYPEDRGTNYAVRLGNDIAKMMASDLAAAQAKAQ
jgi:protoporphyrinogen oxidase